MGDGGDGNESTMQKFLERMRKLEEDFVVERALKQMAYRGGSRVSSGAFAPSGASVPTQGTSATPATPGRSARDIKGCHLYYLYHTNGIA